MDGSILFAIRFYFSEYCFTPTFLPLVPPESVAVKPYPMRISLHLLQCVFHLGFEGAINPIIPLVSYSG